MAFKVSVDHSKCIGCGACTSQCDNFEMVDVNGEQKANPKQEIVEEKGCNEEAAGVCPGQAITVTEADGGEEKKEEGGE